MVKEATKTCNLFCSVTVEWKQCYTFYLTHSNLSCNKSACCKLETRYVLINYIINILHINFFSFPGGKKDPEDSSLIETAIREMDEELGLDRRHVEVWAPMPTMPDRVGHCLSKIS